MIRVFGRGGAAEPGGAADQRLVELLPQRRRPHEGLVVEAGLDERREPGIDGREVEGERGPAVLAPRLEAVIELDPGRARVRLAPRAGAKLDERVRLLGTGREHAARAVILEGAPDEPHAVGKKRRGKRIAGKAGHDAAVEGKAQRPRAIDEPARNTELRGCSSAPDEGCAACRMREMTLTGAARRWHSYKIAMNKTLIFATAPDRFFFNLPEGVRESLTRKLYLLA